MKYVNDRFETSIISTTGVDFNNKEIDVHGQKVKLQIWDTAGQEKFRALATQYYRRAHGIALFYDVTNKLSFTHLQNWLDSISSNTSTKIPVILLANKCDLQPIIPRNQAEDFARDKNLPIFFTSAKTGDNLDEAFRTLAEMSMEVGDNQQSNLVKLDKPAEENKKKGCC